MGDKECPLLTAAGDGSLHLGVEVLFRQLTHHCCSRPDSLGILSACVSLGNCSCSRNGTPRLAAVVVVQWVSAQRRLQQLPPHCQGDSLRYRFPVPTLWMEQSVPVEQEASFSSCGSHGQWRLAARFA